MMRKTLFLIFLCVSISTIADDQNWTENSITLKQPNGLSFHFVSEVKYRSWDGNDGVFTKNWVFGVGKNLRNGFSISLNYKQELNRKSNGNDTVERRPNLDISWKKRFGNQSAFDFRLRTEIRKYDDGLKRDHYRFRFRFRLTAKRSVLRYTVEPYLAIEPFYDTISDSFNKYRFYAGMMVPIFRHMKIRLGYILEDARNRSPHHIFATGLSLSF